jgi:hypothetical protein
MLELEEGQTAKLFKETVNYNNLKLKYKMLLTSKVKILNLILDNEEGVVLNRKEKIQI